MIKRRFYRLEHADEDGAADSSSSSSDSELKEHATGEESGSESESEHNNNDDNIVVEELNQNNEASSASYGYESEASSADEINVDSTRVECNDDDDEEIENDKGIFADDRVSTKRGIDVKKSNSGVGKLSVPMLNDVPDCIFKIKSVFRCRICPSIVCLTEETMRAHLKSKRHARSEKLMKENRLKAILNSDGQIENQETAAEMHARIVALAEDSKKTKKSNRRQRRRKMSEKKEYLLQKVVKDSATKKTKEETCKPAKKKRKSEN